MIVQSACRVHHNKGMRRIHGQKSKGMDIGLRLTIRLFLEILCVDFKYFKIFWEYFKL